MIVLGYDPGGADSANGVALLDATGERVTHATQSVCSVDEAVAWFEGKVDGRAPDAAGIDTLLYWETGRCGWRQADRWLKQRYPDVRGSVFSANSALGCMAVQGMALAMRLRERWPGIALSEAHPKVLYRALSGRRYAWGAAMDAWLGTHLGRPAGTGCANDHEWDALISAWAAWMGSTGRWTLDLRSLSAAPIEPVRDVTYWWPPDV
ncbi:DUF429 domain-containing protein [Azospirillum halopraeferens]|uniref:DUF429 domain-containing protein n=1 Tax=Azospirillum halopraeferens TaxID=34010 RepID=UPI000423C459|nr:DUF429 domain-containing protein [Azospirillum halopraeferens]